MYYAGEGVISQEPFDGSIEITQEQYVEALEGMLNGKVISVKNGFSIEDPAPIVSEPEPDPQPEPDQAPEPEPEPDPQPELLTAADVDLERDRRISDGFYFDGVFYQARPEDRENIAGAVSAAGIAIRNGAQEGDYHWKGNDMPFVWIAADNSLHQMDAQTVEAFGLAALAHKEYFIFAARRIKDMPAIPENYQDDDWWFQENQPD